jgi:hypothetical protein
MSQVRTGRNGRKELKTMARYHHEARAKSLIFNIYYRTQPTIDAEGSANRWPRAISATRTLSADGSTLAPGTGGIRLSAWRVT